MRTGQRVSVVAGPAKGRVGVVQFSDRDGIAVRLVALDPLWPFTQLLTLPARELRRIRPRRIIQSPVAPAAPF